MTTHSITTKAYTKIILHVAKYPHAVLNGVLLGTQKDSTVKIVDAVPLFHQHTLNPMLDVAFSQIESYAASESLQIVGLYTTTLVKGEVPEVAFKICDKIQSYQPSACLLLIEDTPLSPSQLATLLHVKKSSRWTSQQGNIHLHDSTPADVFQFISKLIANRTEQKLVDWDNHLDDCKRDWINSTLLPNSTE